MFGRLATIRIRNAEEALGAGRLDEAYEIAVSDDLAKHERILKVRESLASSYLVRGQERLLARQFAEAMADFDRAGRCGFQLEKVREWRKRAEEAQGVERVASAERQAALQEARRRAEAGSILGAAEALANSPAHDPQREAMVEAIDRQARRAADALSEAVAALDRDDLHTASSQIHMAKKLHTKLDGLSGAENRLVERAVQRAAGSFEAGRLDRAKQDLAVLADLDCRRADRVEIEEQVRQASEAAKAFASHDYARTALLLGRLAKMNLRADWIAEVRKHLDAMELASESILEGPLGLLAHLDEGARPSPNGKPVKGGFGDTLPAIPAAGVQPPPIARGVRTVEPAAFENDSPQTPGLPRRVMIRIDGVGSFLLVRGDRVTIGRAGPGATADVQLVSDLSEKQAEIVRAGEDYFVVSQSGVELAGANIDHALLQNSDRIRLGKRVRMKFMRPSLKSSTAILELGEGVRMETDCRKVILWSGPVLIGGTRECHIPALQGRGEFVLMERGGKMYVKEMGPAGQARLVEFGVQTAAGDLRFTAMAMATSVGVGRVVG